MLVWPGSSGAHPSLYFGTSELTALQARAADSTVNALGYDFQSVFEAMRDRADQYKSEPCTYTVQIPNSSGVGSETWSYTVSPAMPPGHPNNPGYPPWTGLSRLIQQRLETMAFVYVVTGDDSYLTNASGHGALDLALDVAAWTQWTDPGYSCGGQTCLDTAHLTMGTALTYDLGFGAMSDAERATLRDAIVQLGVTPLATDVTAANQSGGASAWFNGYALRVTGLAVGAAAVAEDVGAAATGWLTLARDSTQAFFSSQGSDGGTYEGQLYGAYAVDQLVIGAHALAQNGIGAELFDDAWLGTLPRFAGAFLGSAGKKLANFGDSSQAAYWGPTMLALAAHGHATAQWYLSITGLAKPGSPIAFVWAAPELAARPPDGSGTSLFRDVGHAALRAGFDGTPVVAVKSGPPSTPVGHNHFDHNSFMVSANGEWIATDTGYRDYFNTPKRLYTTDSVGHNTVMVDKSVSSGGDQVSGGQVETAEGTLDYVFDGVGYAKIVANAAATYEAGLLTRFGRRVLYAKPDVVLVFDDLAAPAAHEYSFLLHASATSTLEAAAGPGEMCITGLTARLQAFVASSTPLAAGYPQGLSHPGAEEYGPYAEWRTAAVPDARFAVALVPGRIAHTELSNPGFEQDLTGWQPRFSDGTHSVDSAESHSGAQSARIEFVAANSGYFYSEPLTVLPAASITAQVFVRAQASGTLSIQPYWMHEGAYVEEPAGESASIDAAGAASWTSFEVSTTVPPSGVDAVRIALQFNGTGTVWFDDASFETSPRDEPTPLSRAVVLGDPPAGLVVEGPFGVEAAASLVGAASNGTTTLVPASADIAAVPSLSSDGSLFALGLSPGGSLRRAFLQGGTFVAVGDVRMVTASDEASFDVAVVRDRTGCPTLFATQVVTLEAPPYRVRGSAEQVMLDGERVPFTVEGDEVVFPMGSDVGPGCPFTAPGADAGAGGSEPGPGSAGVSGDDSGCSCRAAGSRAAGVGWLGLGALAGALVGVRRRRAP